MRSVRSPASLDKATEAPDRPMLSAPVTRTAAAREPGEVPDEAAGVTRPPSAGLSVDESSCNLIYDRPALSGNAKGFRAAPDRPWY